MTTGMDVLNRALRLLSYTDASGNVDPALSAELYKRGLEVLNQVLAELWPLEHLPEEAENFAPLTSIQQELPLSVFAAQTAMPYGVAMFLAQADGDGSNQQFFASLYQQKRSAVTRPPRHRDDVLPRVCEG